jgi:hypothetical protein
VLQRPEHDEQRDERERDRPADERIPPSPAPSRVARSPATIPALHLLTDSLRALEDSPIARELRCLPQRHPERARYPRR